MHTCLRSGVVSRESITGSNSFGQKTDQLLIRSQAKRSAWCKLYLVDFIFDKWQNLKKCASDIHFCLYFSFLFTFLFWHLFTVLLVFVRKLVVFSFTVSFNFLLSFTICVPALNDLNNTACMLANKKSTIPYWPNCLHTCHSANAHRGKLKFLSSSSSSSCCSQGWNRPLLTFGLIKSLQLSQIISRHNQKTE